MEEALLAVGLAHAGKRGLVRRAGRAVVAEELHIAAERHRRELPAGAVAVIEAGQFGAEADRKYHHLDAAPPRHQEVPELVEEHDDAENEQEWEAVFDDPAPQRADMSEKIKTHELAHRPRG